MRARRLAEAICAFDEYLRNEECKTEEAFLARFAGTPVMRAKREGLARNACVALGNVGGPGAANALGRALNDASSLVREHAAWALGRIGSPRARRHVMTALGTESDPEVVASLRESIDLMDGSG